MANDAGTAFINVEPDLKGFGGRLSSGIDPHVDETSSHITSKLGGAFKAVAGVAGGIFVGAKLVELGGDLLKLGTQVDTFGKKSQTVFEGSNADVTKWAKTNASAFGLTDDSLRGLAANFGDLLKPMGFTAAQAADMSTKVVGLSGALSAWSGGTRTAAEVSNILAKAMLGERDGLKELGISISENDVTQRLAAKGQKELTGAALEQAKALATQELIFEKSSDAQKAWADGSLDAVKKQNALKEKIAELREDLAAKLQPAFAAAIGFIVDKAIPGFDKLGKAISPIVAQAKLGFAALKSAFSGEGVTSDGFVGAMERIGVVVRQIVERVRAEWPQIKAIITETIDTVRTVISGFVDVVKTIWANFGDQIKTVVSAAWEFVKTTVQAALDVIQGIIKVVTGIIHGDWSQVWEGIKQILSGVWDGIQARIELGLTIIREGLSAGWEVIKAVFTNAWDAIFQVARDGVAKVVDVFLGMVGLIIGAAASAFGWIPGIGGKLRDAKDAFDSFREEVNASIRGIDAEKTIRINIVEAVSRENNSNLGTAGDPIAPEAPAPSDSESLPDRAHGIDEGPLPGRKGQPLLVRAHGGEWVVTPEQMAALRSGRSGGSTASAGLGPSAGEIGAAVVAALAANPARAYVVASDVARGLQQSRPR